MSIAKYFKLSSYCLIASGFAAVAVTGVVGAGISALFGLVLAASWYTDTERVWRTVPGWLLNAVTLAYFPVYFLDYRYFSQSFVVSTIHLVLFIAALKLMTRSSDRDFVYLYLLSFGLLLAASILTVDLIFIVLLLFFLISAVGTIVVFEMRRSNEAAQKQGKISPMAMPGGKTGLDLVHPFPAGSLAAMSAAMTLTILVVAVPLFFFLPRATLGVSHRPSAISRLISGFSETVELGEIGTIKESDALVMQVKTDMPPDRLPSDLKWRGIALDHYDGRSWSRSRPRRRRVPTQGGFYKLQEYSQTTDLLMQTFYLEPLATDVVFAAHKALAISGDLKSLERDDSGNIFSLHRHRKVRYSAVSELVLPDPSLISEYPGPVPDSLSACCLQLPAEDRRVFALAREATASAPTPYEKAVVLEHYLRNNYGYSLELSGSPDSEDPLAEFLFDVRRGHCEYFASAMAVMLRSLGIPSRLVNGFRSGEYNRYSGAWTVRQYNAHSWVEAWFPPYGWIEFDPTPPDPIRRRSALQTVLTQMSDALNLWWAEDVVNYDRLSQFRLLEVVRRGFRVILQSLSRWLQDMQAGADSGMRRVTGNRMEFLLLAAGIFITSLLALLVLKYKPLWARRIRRSLRRPFLAGGRGAEVIAFYRDALDMLESRGMFRHPDQTPAEFALSLKDHPAGPPMAALTAVYNKVRFGPASREDDFAAARLLLGSLREILKGGSKEKKPD